MSSKPMQANSHDQQPALDDPANDIETSTKLPEIPTTPETPGVNMPGSFPTPKQGLLAPDVQGFASKVYDQFAAPQAVRTAGDKVAEYLPSSVAPYLLSKTQDEGAPSQETSQNDHPSTSGNIATHKGDQSVDRDVGASANETNISPILTTTNNNPVHRRPSDPLERHTGYIPGTLQDDTSLAKLPEERRLENLPSHDDETGARLGKSGGVGALPGSAGESSVALLPDERKEKQETHSGASTDASIRTLRGSSFAPSPLAQIHGVPQTAGRDHAFSRDEEKVFGANTKDDLDAQPDSAVVTKGDNKPAVPISDTACQEHRQAVGAGSGGLAGAGSANQVASEKKSGFVHKVKGEMKILSGKMSHNETKIEEGRKMMGKN